MFDTNIVVIGNVLSPPEWRRTTSSNTLVTTFKIASTARRQDRETGQWVDGNQLRVRVNCWRRLAEGVASSVTIGDPVVVSGRLYTRDWNDAAGNQRTSYEMEAVAVGHDLSRGRAKFFRNKHAVTVTAEVPEIEAKVRGESAPPISEDEAPAVYGEGLPDTGEPSFDELPVDPDEQPMALQTVPGGAFEPFDTNLILAEATPGGSEDSDDEKPEGTPESDEDPDDEPDAVSSPPVEATPAPKRVRSRTTRRQPVAA